MLRYGYVAKTRAPEGIPVPYTGMTGLVGCKQRPIPFRNRWLVAIPSAF